MPRVRPLCEEQRVEARCKKRTQALVDGLVVHKARTKALNKDISQEAGIGINMVGRLLRGDQVMMRLDAFWRLLDLAGLEIRKREEPLT